MSEKNPEAPADIESDLQRKLLRRVAFAGLLIAALLGALALIDHIGKSPDLVEDEGPVFHAPVPVGKKEVTQPVTPVEQLPPAGEEVPPAPPAAPAATEPSAATPEPPPEKPEVAARPMLPPPPPETRPSARSGGSPALLRTPRLPEPPAEGSARNRGSAAIASPASSASAGKSLMTLCRKLAHFLPGWARFWPSRPVIQGACKLKRMPNSWVTTLTRGDRLYLNSTFGIEPSSKKVK